MYTKEEKKQARAFRTFMGLCIDCGEDATDGYIRCVQHRLRHSVTSNGWYHKAREAIFARYGNVCGCCGESNKMFLSIDHVGGGGNKHRKENGGNIGVLKLIYEDPDYSKYQLRCYNCNLASGFRGFCPHEMINDVNVLG